MSDKEIKARRAEYVRNNPLCEYALACGRHVNFGYHFSKRKCCEHIWNRNGKHSECISNWATVSPAAHDWKHANSTVARIAISHFKWQKGEFDLDELKQCSGKNVPGWIEYKLEQDDYPGWLVRKAEELIRAFK